MYSNKPNIFITDNIILLVKYIIIINISKVIKNVDVF